MKLLESRPCESGKVPPTNEGVECGITPKIIPSSYSRVYWKEQIRISLIPKRIMAKVISYFRKEVMDKCAIPDISCADMSGISGPSPDWAPIFGDVITTEPGLPPKAEWEFMVEIWNSLVLNTSIIKELSQQEEIMRKYEQTLVNQTTGRHESTAYGFLKRTVT